ncbi:MAG: ribosome maturation factor RimM [Bacteriovoracia bacterium]
MKQNLILLGTASKPHGLKGHALFFLTSGKDTHLKKGHKLWLVPGSGSELPAAGAEFEIEEIQKGNDIRVKLMGVVDRTALEKLLPFEIFCDRTQFPALPRGQNYVSDLLGLRAIDESGAEVGVVADWYETPGHLVFTIRLKAGGEVDVPYVKHFFPNVDLSQGTIQVVLPEAIE